MNNLNLPSSYYNIENKKNGVVYTPKFIVINMLDSIDYRGKKILNKHIIDNSCGDGSFLLEVATRYIEASRENKKNDYEIAEELEKFIHGIEIDFFAYKNCVSNLNNLLVKFNINKKIKWDIVCGDTLDIKSFDNKMDYVVGNPPYIRIHDLQFDYRKFQFSANGMTDLYLIFFELGIKMLNDNGVMTFITPNSYFTSKSGLVFRKYLVDNLLLSKMINLGHYNPFDGITTYPAIVVLSKGNKNKIVNYYEYNKDIKKEIFIDTLAYSDFYINNAFYFGNKMQLTKFEKIITTEINKYLTVKNGVSTNLDSIFYNESYKGRYIKEAIKISKMQSTKVFYPYDKKNQLIPIEKIMKNNPKIYDILIENKMKLEKRSLQQQKWYEFARTQGLNDVWKPKMVINNIIKDIKSIKLKVIDAGVIPYSGYYILSERYDFEYLQNLLLCDEFINYLKILRKDKNGEYYFFSSNDLLVFLSYKISKEIN